MFYILFSHPYVPPSNSMVALAENKNLYEVTSDTTVVSKPLQGRICQPLLRGIHGGFREVPQTGPVSSEGGTPGNPALQKIPKGRMRNLN